MCLAHNPPNAHAGTIFRPKKASYAPAGYQNDHVDVVAPPKKPSAASSEADRKAAETSGLSVLTGATHKPSHRGSNCLGANLACARAVLTCSAARALPSGAGVCYAVVVDSTDDELWGGGSCIAECRVDGAGRCWDIGGGRGGRIRAHHRQLPHAHCSHGCVSLSCWAPAPHGSTSGRWPGRKRESVTCRM